MFTRSWTRFILCPQGNFMQVLDLLIFRQPGLAIDAKAAAIFTLLSVLKGRCKDKTGFVEDFSMEKEQSEMDNRSL